MTKQEQSFEMARRLKALRENAGVNGKPLSHDKLSKALAEQFGVQISKASLMSYEIQTEHHSKIKNGKYPNLNMGVEYIHAFAQFYGVSTDYLLGLSDLPTINPKAAEVAEYTGLSVSAVKVLHDWHSSNYEGMYIKGETVSYIDLLSEILESANDFYSLMGEMGSYLVYGGALPQSAYSTKESDLSTEEWERFHRWANGNKREIVSRDEACELHLQLTGEAMKRICRNILEKAIAKKEAEENGEH